MRKRFSLVLIAVLFATTSMFSTTALAEERPPEEQEEQATEPAPPPQTSWEFSARLRPRLEARFNHHFGLAAEELNYGAQPDRADLFTQQSRLGVVARRGALTGTLTLQHTARFGDFGGNELTAPPLHLYQAFLRYDAVDWLVVDAGRFELAYGDERVLGSVGWSQVGRAWDGVRFGLRPTEGIGFDLFSARYQDGLQGFLEGDNFLSGLYATVSDPLPLLTVADVYLLYDARLAENDGRHLIMPGARLGLAIAGADFTGEGGYQFGEVCADGESCVPISAYFFDLEAGYAVAGLRPFVGFSMASGNNPETEQNEAYDQLYPTGHRWLGYMDLIGPRTNLREVRLGLAAQLDPVGVELAFHDFTRLQPEAERVGREFNTKVNLALVQGLSVQVGHGIFLPDQGISRGDQAPRGVANWSFLQLVGGF